MSAKPAMPTSATVNPIDISFTEKATHVYIKVEDPQGLSGRFEGPYPITSRPSRTQVEVRIGSYVNGTPRLQVYNWSSCKIAHLRPEATEGSRPRLGRPATTAVSNSSPAPNAPPVESSPTEENKQTSELPAKIQTSETARAFRSTRNPKPQYVDGIQLRQA